MYGSRRITVPPRCSSAWAALLQDNNNTKSNKMTNTRAKHSVGELYACRKWLFAEIEKWISEELRLDLDLLTGTERDAVSDEANESIENYSIQEEEGTAPPATSWILLLLEG